VHCLSSPCLQDVSGGKPVLLEGVDLPLWGLEVDVEEGKREFAEFSAKNNTADQVGRLPHVVPSQCISCFCHLCCLLSLPGLSPSQ
jgi:hypothetical protein